MKSLYTNQSKNLAVSVVITIVLVLSGLTQAKAQQAQVSSENITPALMMSFTGLTSGQEGQLTWVTENETSAKWFVVERSANGSDFDSIGRVMSINDGNMATYTYVDANPSNGNNYYRLCEVDVDGVDRYSSIISLEVKVAVSEKLEIYPNPASAVVNYAVTSHSSDEVTVQIFNLAGALVSARVDAISAGTTQQSIAISNLRSGSYILKITGKQGMQYTQLFSKI